MAFCDVFGDDLSKIRCTIKELSLVSGVSASVISRYRSGERTPESNSVYLKRLAEGMASLAEKRGIEKLSCEALYDNYLKRWGEELPKTVDTKAFARKVDYVLTQLRVNISAMAKALNYDSSFISRIRNGNRMPSDVHDFVHRLAIYLAKEYSVEITALLVLQDMEQKQLTAAIETFLLEPAGKQKEWVTSLLQRLEDFDLYSFMHSIHGDERKVLTPSFLHSTNRRFHGIEGQRNGELSFLRCAVLPKSIEPVFIYNDIGIDEITADMGFTEKWIQGLAMLLKKNISIQVIHNLNRPFEEVIKGGEMWFPLYMTGLVSPYYLRGTCNDFLRHLLYTSGTYAFSGGCVKGCYENAGYVLTNNRDDFEFYRERATDILKNASPLIEIYGEEKEEQYRRLYREELQKSEKCEISFRNLEIRIQEGKWVCITKCRAPKLHLVIRHPLLRAAIEKWSVSD